MPKTDNFLFCEGSNHAFLVRGRHHYESKSLRMLVLWLCMTSSLLYTSCTGCTCRCKNNQFIHLSLKFLILHSDKWPARVISVRAAVV